MKNGSFFVIGILLPSFFLPVCGMTVAEAEKLERDTVASADNLPQNLDKLSKFYFLNNRYNDFVNFIKEKLSGIKDKEKTSCLAYYIAFARFQQLRYLENNQLWQEYFDKGVAYRQEFVRNTEAVLEGVRTDVSLYLDALLLRWKFFKEDQDVKEKESLDNLVAAVESYAEKSKDFEHLKVIASALSQAGEISSARYIYGLYAKTIVKADKTVAEIKLMAENALSSGESELAVILFDFYVSKLDRSKKDDFLKEISAIIRVFSYKSKFFNAEYSEKLFSLLDESGLQDAEGEELLYCRAKNLQHAGILSSSSAEFRKLISKFPQSKFRDEALFKSAVIELYVIGNIDGAKAALLDLNKDGVSTAYRVLAVYHLGLLDQWQGNLTSAKKYYQQAFSSGKSFLPDDLSKQLSARISEINNGQPIEYNLRMFLDVSLKNNSQDKYTSLELKVEPDNVAVKKDVSFSASSSQTSFGCLVQKIAYLWSGQTGSALPDINSSKFSSIYSDSGTKLVNLVVINSSGIIISRSMVILDAE